MDETCENAKENPICPYITEINQQGKDIKLIKKALIGDNMQGGIVAEIHKFKMLWNITIFISGATATGLIALAIRMVLK